MTIDRVLVTGASSGIGAACVLAFQNMGAEVLGVDQSAESGADDHLALDLTSPACAESVAAFSSGRALDVLVNNAGLSLDKAAIATTAEDFDRVIAANLRAPLLVSSALYPLLARRRGSIVNVSSVHAVATSPSVAAYAASKGGLVSLTRALAIEWAPDVRVNSVLPGAVDTRMLRSGLDRTGSTLEQLAGRHGLNRVGSPEEIAEAVVFLASSGFTTGTTLTVDGGATARLSTE